MPKRNYKSLAIVIVIVIVLVILFAWPKINDPYREQKKKWKETGIGCIGGHVNIAQHIHSQITVLIDGEKQVVSANIGNVSGCMAELHSHDDMGTIHIESGSPSKEFNLGQFFAVWGEPLEKEGYQIKVTSDDEEVSEPENLILKDKQKIVVEYTKN